MRNSIYSLVATGLLATSAFATDDHSGHADHSGHGAMHEGVQVEAVIHTIDGTTVNLSHDPIPEIGWPAMTMDLQLLEGAEVSDVAEGQGALIVLEKGEDGMYGIRALMPKE
ncbi:cation transporter [Roseovarius faecimaris]|uniref:Cation transporter n=1 Tax=Roseovarius faecimaris TaxID=2494550 RepID=A0A6I6INV3_9RHOB|nr:copper-binding protein [Roseovarius faecimaris]QGX97493.1 cation transporter [Roseovarius faecimaris]